MKENEVVTCGTLMNNLYHIDCVVIQVDNVEKSLKRLMSLKIIQRLLSYGPLATLNLE